MFRDPARPSASTVAISGIWGKYRDGKVCPKLHRGRDGKPTLIERVEKRFPGTDYWAYIPFWDVLSYIPMSMADLKELYLCFPRHIKNLLVIEKQPYNRMFWRRPVDIETSYRQLVKIGDLAAITAVLALIKECEVTQNQEMHQKGLSYWALCTCRLQKNNVLSPLIRDMNKIIEDRYHRISYVNSDDGEYFKITKAEIRSILWPTD